MECSDIKLSVDPAREMLETLRSIGKDLPWKDRALRFLDDKAYCYMMFAKNYSSQDLIEIMRSLSKRHEPSDQRLRWLYKELLGCMDRLDDFLTFLNELEKRKAKIVSKAVEKARNYLPESAIIQADIYVVVGGSDAYGVNLLDNRAIVMDVVEYISEIEELVAMLAHELHHKAQNRSRKIASRFHINGPKNLERAYSIVSELIGEGVATLVTFPHGLAHKYFNVEPKIGDEYKKVDEGIQQICRDLTEERANAIFEALYNNAGPIYMVGCNMARKIEETLGREKLIAAAQEPLPFFQVYRKAATKSGEGYEFSASTMDIVKKLQGQIDLM